MAYSILKSYKLKIDPFLIFEVFKDEPNCFFLDSSLNTDYCLGRYSFLGIDPFFIYKSKGKDPFFEIRGILEKYKIRDAQLKLPFLGGAVGYFAYDLGLILEKKIKTSPKPDYLGIADCYLAFYNLLLIIDHLKHRLYLFTVGFPERHYRLAKVLSETNLKKIQRLLSRINLSTKTRYLVKAKDKNIALTSNFSKADYLLAVKKAKEYIRKGDIYQVNLAQSFQSTTSLSGFKIYRQLRKISPSYFSAYLDAGDCQIISSSPERFLALEDETVVTRPMKGTRPRSENKYEDRGFKKELLESAKDKAELMMIVDLERNDLGRVCSYDSIKVRTLRQLEEYSTVFQTTATIEGRLHKEKDRIDLLRACFPGGSITGCPKIRAMEIIEELEPTRRFIYTGCLGYFSFSGNMDTSILIRTILKKDNRLYFGVGGGIVADSEPQAEYQETLVKARGIVEAIKG